MTEETLFSDALALSPTDRSEFLTSACAGDSALRRRVEKLLAAFDPNDGFLENPALSNGRTDPEAANSSAPNEKIGAHIGPYRLLQQIGEGGMGVVYMAEQETPVRRRVALKIIKPGMDTKQVVARFEAERQALALMNHANIAQVFDAGATESGRPFVVMELVNGISITKFCDQEQLTPRERLELFVPICQAIQHAHQKGIIHRDLKPSNVLIALYDGQPVPKVIDFGVAKATNQRLTERTMFTEFGQVIGTLEYMSPEQAERNALDIDTRSDVYSLGVILYELLTGSTPLDKKKLYEAGFVDMMRMIREDEPAAPSTRLSQSGDALRAISAQRKTDPVALSRLMRGELDWIVMKCLEKDRSRRYETANGLARDIERHLHDEPVEACPPTAGYRLRKFLRKHRGPVTAVAGAAALLVAGIVGTTWGMVEALTQKREARQQAEIAKAVSDFLQNDLLGQADVSMQPSGAEGRDPDVKVRTLLERTAQALDGRFADQPLTEAALRMTLAATYRSLGFSAKALAHADRVVAVRSAALGPHHYDTLQAKLVQALLHYDLGRLERTEALCHEVLEAPICQSNQADLHLPAQEYLAQVFRDRGQYEQAEATYEQALRHATDRYGVEHAKTQRIKHGLAVIYHYREMPERAADLFHEVALWRTAHLGRDHRDTQNSLHGLAAAYTSLGKFDQAVALYDELITTTNRLRPDHPNLLNYKTSLALLRFRQGSYDQAESLYREVLAARLAKRGPDDTDTLRAQNSLASTLARQGKNSLAIPLLCTAAAGLRSKMGLLHPDTQLCICNLIVSYEALNQHELAEPLCRELTIFWEAQADGVKSAIKPRLAVTGHELLKRGKFAAAESILRVELVMCDKLDPNGWTLAWARVLLGAALLEQKKLTDAEPLLNAGYIGLTQHAAHLPPLEKAGLIEIVERLTKIYTDWPDKESDKGHAAKAAEWTARLEALKSPPPDKGGCPSPGGSDALPF